MTGAIKYFLGVIEGFLRGPIYWMKSLFSFVFIFIFLIALVIAVLVFIFELPLEIRETVVKIVATIFNQLFNQLLERQGLPGIIETVLTQQVPAVVATLVLVFIAYVKLKQNSEYRRAAFLTEYVSKIFTDKKLSDTYHYLVYTYQEEKFCEVKMKVKRNKQREWNQKAIWRCLEPLQDGRKNGFRFYHPEYFLHSDEEKRLDSLLGYFNIIAYYYKKEKLLSIKDIDGSVGYHLAVMSARPVIREYMKLIENDWKTKTGTHAKYFGMKQPFHYLKEMLDDLDRRRKAHRNGR